MAERLQTMGQPNYKDGFKLTLQPKMLDLPLQWKKPQTIFVNSMSDLFHIQRVFDVMRRAPWHCFQVLTKRADRLADVSPEIDWPENVWMGVSVENANYIDRIDDLRTTGAAVKFLSLEPLLGPLPKLKLKGIDWVIVGGESGPRARPMAPEWATRIRDQCAKAGVAFFFKQWGGKNKKRAGRVLEGKTYDAMPGTAPTVPVARVSRAAKWPAPLRVLPWIRPGQAGKMPGATPLPPSPVGGSLRRQRCHLYPPDLRVSAVRKDRSRSVRRGF